MVKTLETIVAILLGLSLVMALYVLYLAVSG